MPSLSALERHLRATRGLTIVRDAPLRDYTRFAIGGPAALLVQAASPEAFRLALQEAKSRAVPLLVMGGGSNLVVSDTGFDGLVLRLSSSAICQVDGNRLAVSVEAGAVLQDVVDWTIAAGLSGMETLTGIPGSIGGAVYGNAGAYGRSIHELIETVMVTDGEQVHMLQNADCRFGYRESIFKQRKDWTILEAKLKLSSGIAAELKKKASEIYIIRAQKYPPDMKCAGSIFKNLFFVQLPAPVREQIPPALVRDGKVPSAWFLEQTGVRGMRLGDIEVAPYHANLVYNLGHGNSSDLLTVINDLKRRVHERFGFYLEEEVQYVGFATSTGIQRIA